MMQFWLSKLMLVFLIKPAELHFRTSKNTSRGYKNITPYPSNTNITSIKRI